MIFNTENTGDLTWGHLKDSESFGRKTSSEDFILWKEETNFKIKTEASHCLLYARNNSKIFDVYHPRASILMQLRFDGHFGFPGGIVDKGENSLSSLNRELKEEMCLDLTKHSVQSNNYIISHYNKKSGLLLHFYALEVTMEELINIEHNALRAKDYGVEVLGNVRIPLYTMGDGYRGFPAFLKNQFIGNSKEQLLFTIKHLNLMSESEITRALNVL